MEPKLITAFGVYTPDSHLLTVMKTRAEAEQRLLFHGYTNVEQVEENKFWGREIEAFEGKLTVVYRSEAMARLRFNPVGCF